MLPRGKLQLHALIVDTQIESHFYQTSHLGHKYISWVMKDISFTADHALLFPWIRILSPFSIIKVLSIFKSSDYIKVLA